MTTTTITDALERERDALDASLRRRKRQVALLDELLAMAEKAPGFNDDMTLEAAMEALGLNQAQAMAEAERRLAAKAGQATH